MPKQTSDYRKKALSEFAPHLWDMYQVLLESRTKLEDKLNYFLAIDALIILGYMQLCAEHVLALEFIFVIPLLLLLLPIVILLAEFFPPKDPNLPWLKLETLTRGLDQGSIHVLWISSIYSCAYRSFDYRKGRRAVLRICLALVGTALLWLLGMVILNICGSGVAPEARAAILVFALLAVGYGGYAIGRRWTHERDDRWQEVHAFLKEWLDEGSKS